ncbi:MAG: sugar ABC transporter ATP-binding protein [Spirochaetes bacterium]|nr:MAG: sugar ABC transporter ATP-binding protein [Spirochaetota bacterium]RKX88802.1 MAG: sugar ABC transporter ATP-binding protein [Spirochaetota bacterium]
MSKISLDNLTKKFGIVAAVDGINLDVVEGEFLTLLGPSGCGKTTTLRMIAGLEEPTSGELYSDEKVLFSKEKGVYVPPEMRNLGFMFQSYALWPHMNVTRNITLGLESKKIPSSEIKTRVNDVLNKVQLKGYEDRFPSELSGGQQQRVALARMIAAKSDIFLMDEPLSNLDAMLRIDMRSELKHLHNELGATTVYVTHDQVEALTLSDRIVVMNNGKIIQCDTPEAIYMNPQNLFVAKFVGSPPINLMKGRIIKENNNLFFKNKAIKLDLKGVVAPETESSDIIAAVRAEDIEVSPSSSENQSEAFNVYSVLPAGSETIITLQRGETELAVKLSGFSSTKMNDSISIKIRPEKISFFNPETEELIR